MKTFLVYLNGGEKVNIEGDNVTVKDGIIYVSNEVDEKIAILTNIAMIVEQSSINKKVGKKAHPITSVRYF